MAENKKQINCFIDVDSSTKNFLLILDLDTNWKTFSNEIKNQLTNYDSQTHWNYYYLDEMGDKISFGNDEELNEAFHYAQSLKDSFFVIFVDTNNKQELKERSNNDSDYYDEIEKYFSLGEMICEMKESVKPIERYMRENSPELIPIFDQTTKILYGSVKELKRLVERDSAQYFSSFLSLFSSNNFTTMNEFPYFNEDNREHDNSDHLTDPTQNDNSTALLNKNNSNIDEININNNNKNNNNNNENNEQREINEFNSPKLEINNENKNEEGDLNKANKVKAKKKLRISDIKSPNQRKTPFPPSPHPLSHRFRNARRLNPHNSPKNTKKKKNSNLNNSINNNNNNNINNNNNNNINNANNSISPKEPLSKNEKGVAKREMRRKYIGDLNQRIERIDNEISEIKSILNTNSDNDNPSLVDQITNQSDPPSPALLALSELPPAILSTNSPLLPDEAVLNPAEEECYRQLQLMGFTISPSLVAENNGDLFLLLDKLQ